MIASVPEVRGVMSHVGRPDDGTHVTSFINLEFHVPLKPMEEWREGMTRQKIEAELSRKFEAFPGLDFSFSQLIRDNIDEALSGIKGANSVKLFGSDLAKLEEYGQKVVDQLGSVQGIQDVGLFHIIGQPSLEIQIDRNVCARYGLNVEDVESVIQVAISGQAFTQMVEGDKRYDIVLRLTQELRNDPEDIARIPIDIRGVGDRPATRIPLAHLATIVPDKSGAS